MAKNRNMALKHDKAKKEGIKEAMNNQFAFMASSKNMSSSAKWQLNHKPDYSTVNYKAKCDRVLAHA